jgi:hypothetical protein
MTMKIDTSTSSTTCAFFTPAALKRDISTEKKAVPVFTSYLVLDMHAPVTWRFYFFIPTPHAYRNLEENVATTTTVANATRWKIELVQL